MKKIILFALIVFTTFSCSNDNDTIFDQTADERKGKNRKEFFDQLNSTNWVIELFPESNRGYGGYSIAASFNKNYKVTLLNEFDHKGVNTSYDIISKSGSILTFNGFNKGIHYFSNPSSASPEGKYGISDYEFIYLNKEENVLRTKGVKTRNKIRLIRIQGTLEEYINKVKSVRNYIDKKGLIEFIVGGKFITSTTPDRVVSYFPEKGNGKLSFVYTDKGIRFYEPVNINGVEIYELILDRLENALKTKSGEIVFRLGKNLPIDLSQSSWVIKALDEKECSLKFRKKFFDMYMANKKTRLYSIYKLDVFRNIVLGKTKDNATGIQFMVYNFKRLLFLDVIKYLKFRGTTKEGEINIMHTGGGNGFWRYFTNFSYMVNFITDNSLYTFEMNNPVNPTKVKITSKADPDVWFTINKNR